MTYETTWCHDGVIIRWSGVVSVNELIHCAARISSCAQFDRARWGLHDFTGCSRVTFDDAHMEEVAALEWAAAKHNDRIRFAFVPICADVTAMLESLERAGIDSFEHKAFKNTATANDWLLAQSSQDKLRH